MMMLGMQDDKKLPNDLATAHEVIRVQSELHKALQEALAERRRVRAERRHSSSRRGRAAIRKRLIGDFDAMLGSLLRLHDGTPRFKCTFPSSFHVRMQIAVVFS